MQVIKRKGSLEREFIRDLQAQGYEYLQGLNNHDELIKKLTSSITTVE